MIVEFNRIHLWKTKNYMIFLYNCLKFWMITIPQVWGHRIFMRISTNQLLNRIPWLSANLCKFIFKIFVENYINEFKMVHFGIQVWSAFLYIILLISKIYIVSLTVNKTVNSCLKYLLKIIWLNLNRFILMFFQKRVSYLNLVSALRRHRSSRYGLVK